MLIARCLIASTLIWILTESHPHAEVTSEENMVLIPGGTLEWVASGTPRHSILPAFYIDKYEVTQRDYLAVMGNNPAFFKGPNRPVEKVSWYLASTYCSRRGKRLPSEEEWEYSVQAGRATRFYWGNVWDGDYAWGKSNADKQTHPVGKKKPNAMGLYDLSGNVGEWTASDHELGGKAIRGGSWRNGTAGLETRHRIMDDPRRRFHYVGFRCALSAQ